MSNAKLCQLLVDPNKTRLGWIIFLIMTIMMMVTTMMTLMVMIASCHDYKDRDLSWSNPDQQGLSVLILLLDLVSIIFLSVSSLSRVDNLII